MHSIENFEGIQAATAGSLFLGSPFPMQGAKGGLSGKPGVSVAEDPTLRDQYRSTISSLSTTSTPVTSGCILGGRERFRLLSLRGMIKIAHSFWLLLCTSTAFFGGMVPVPCEGRLPELDVIVYGQVFHRGDAALIPGVGGKVILVARLNGETIATSELDEKDGTFILKVPRDDGIEPRLAGTVRPGERFRVYVSNPSLNIEEEASQSAQTGGFSVPGEKSAFLRRDLSVLGDFLEGGFGNESFIQWAARFGLESLDPDQLMSLDHDGDGSSNFEEYVADTDPTELGERLRVLDVELEGPDRLVRFGPVAEGRIYTLWETGDIVESHWLVVAEWVSNVRDNSRVLGHQAQERHMGFYRLGVRFQE